MKKKQPSHVAYRRGRNGESLGRVVNPAQGTIAETCDAGDHDDVTVPLFAQERLCRLHH
jgi:hypothetical protein